MPKFVLSWIERQNVYYESQVIEAESADEAWDIMWDLSRYESTDMETVDSYDHVAEEIE